MLLARRLRRRRLSTSQRLVPSRPMQHGTKDVRVVESPVPLVTDPQDVVLKTTATCICGSDLHLVSVARGVETEGSCVLVAVAPPAGEGTARLVQAVECGGETLMCCVLRQPSAPVDPPACSGP